MNPQGQQNQPPNQRNRIPIQPLLGGLRFVTKQVATRLGMSFAAPVIAVIVGIIVITFIVVLTGGAVTSVAIPGGTTQTSPTPFIPPFTTSTPSSSSTPSPTPPQSITPIPTQPGSSTPAPSPIPTLGSTNPVLRLVEAIQNLCAGIVSTANNANGCFAKLRQVQPPFNPDTVERLQNSVNAWSGDLQCVDFVQALLIEQNFPQLLRGGGAVGNAIDHAGPNKVDGYNYIKNETGAIMQRGDIVIWQGGTFGHMGYVTQVFPAGKDFEVAEANWKMIGDVQTRVDTREVSDACKKDVQCLWVVGWLRRK